MITLKEIREDLKDIRYYYVRKAVFDAAMGSVGVCKILEKANRYNAAIQYATPRLFDLYICLYLKHYTQESLSIELGYTQDYIYKQHKKLVIFFQSFFNSQI